MSVIDPESHESPHWSSTTKVLVTLGFVAVALVVGWRFQSLMGQLVLAAILAYLMHPIITWIDEQTPFMKRSTVVVLVYLTLVLILVGVSTLIGVAAYDQVTFLIGAAPTYAANTIEFIQRVTAAPIEIGPFDFDLGPLVGSFEFATIQNQLLNLIQPVVTNGTTILAQAASSTLSVVGIGLFVLVVSIYFAIEIPQLGGYVSHISTAPGYREDAERLMREFGRIWSSYLRGQVLLGLLIGVVVSVTLGLLGVRNALALGVLSGVLEFIPILGPVIGTVAALIVALFQPTNYLGLTSIQFTLVVLVAMVIIQQVEGNVLVPRIVGDALDLHPLLVIIAVFMGGSFAGVVGAILAAPVAATAKLLAVYAWRKLFDEEPFPDPEREDDPPLLESFITRGRRLLEGVQGRKGAKPAKPAEIESSKPPADG